MSKGKGNGLTHAESMVKADNVLTLLAGNDATIKGAQLAGDSVLAAIAGNLRIESEQDTDDYAGAALQVGIGASSASSKITTYDETARGSSIRSGGDVIIAATGGDLNIIGSEVAGKNVALVAANNLNVLSQVEKHSLKSESKNAGGGVGIQLSTDGFGIYVEASGGKSKGKGNGLTHAESSIKADNVLTLLAGNDATIKGAQLAGDSVLAAIGGNLRIESEQDTDDYASKNMQASGKLVFGAGVSGSASYSQGKVDSHYKSVNEISGISAGSGGFDITVGGNTHLKGGVIASTADASKNILDTGTLTFEHLSNEAKYKASQIGVSGGTSLNQSLVGAAGAGLSAAIPTGDKSSSETQAGIAQGQIIVRDGPADLSGLDRAPTMENQSLKPIFDEKKVAEQMELGRVAGEVGMRLAGDIEQAMGWEAGSKESVIAHAVVGALAAGLGNGNALQGAVGAAAGEAATPWLVEQLGREALPIVATIIGGVTGGGAGAVTAGAGAQYNYLKHDQVQQLKGKLATCGADEACRADATQWAKDTSLANDNELAGICGADPSGTACGQAIKNSTAYDLDKDVHRIIPDDQMRSTNAMLQAVFDTPNGQKFFGDIDSRKDFFNAYANAMYDKGSEVAWPRAAAQVSGDLRYTWTLLPDSTPGVDSARQWINQTGNVILDYRWTDLKSLYQSSSTLTGSAASNWDIQTLVKEQLQVQSQYDALQGGAKFWTSSGAALAPWLLHPSSPQAPVLDIKNPYWRIGQGIELLERIRKEQNGAWNN
jgi:filamentous hemagglutinin